MNLTLDPLTQLLVSAALIGVCGLSWLVAGMVLRLAPGAALRLAGANTMLAASVMLIAHRADTFDQVAIHGVGLTTIVGYMLLRNALRQMIGQPAVHGWHAVLMASMVCASIFYKRAADSLLIPTVATVVVAAILLLQTAAGVFFELRKEFSTRTAWLLAAPFGLAGLAYALRGMGLLGSILNGAPETIPRSGNTSTLFTISYFVLFINACAVSIFVARLLARLQALAERDTLTGVWNRRVLESRLDEEQARLARSGGSFALVMVDLDHFKRINDRYGHAGGDAVLVHTVAVLGTQLRQIDSLGRFGGEEFMILLPMTGLNAARSVAERMRAVLAANTLEWQGQNIAITASFGVAIADYSPGSGASLLRRADEALYRAKAAGRNRVEVDAQA